MKYLPNVLVISVICLIGLGSESHAFQSSVAVRELVEFVVKKFSKEVVEEGSETFAKRVETVVSSFGDEAIAAIRAGGPRALRWIEEAGVDGAQSARLITKFGDEATWVVSSPARRALSAKLGDDAAAAMIKHGAPAEKLIELGGESAAQAMANLSTRSGRQLAMIADESTTAPIVRNKELMNLLAQYGDKGMEFVWRNKGSLMVGTAMAAFLANPQPFIDGTKSLAEVAAENAVEPIARGIANGTNWTITIVFLCATLVVYLLVKQWILRPRRLA